MDQFDETVETPAQPAVAEAPVTRPSLPDPDQDSAWKSDDDRTPPEAKAAEAEADKPKLADRERNADGTLKPKSAKPRDNPYERVKQATGEAAAAKAEAEAARRERDEWRAKAEAKAAAETKPESSTPTKRPLPEGMPVLADIGTKYQDWDEYDAAKAEWLEQQFEKKLAERDAAAAEQRETQGWQQKFTEAHEAVSNWPALVETADNAVIAAGFRHPDGRANWPPNFFKAVMGSDRMSDLVQFLGSHPEECTQWALDCASDPPPAATVVRRLLERQLSSVAAARPDSASMARPSSAKPPVNRVGSSASATPVDPDDLDFGPEYIAAENARERKRREARRTY